MSEFTQIRPFDNHEVAQVVMQLKDNQTMKDLLGFGFPHMDEKQREEKLLSCRRVSDFQKKIMYPIVRMAISKSVTELTHSGFEKLDRKRAYLFISNHRDIILDTSFLNITLEDLGFKMTASAIGDNLVRKPFLLAFAKMNRNFLIHRGISGKEMLEKSKIVSKFINRYLNRKNRSVWIAQKQGRTKDGNDHTQQGVLKMLSLNCPEELSVMKYFKTLRIVPMSISYELDPTDILKMPFLVAEHKGEEYKKSSNEDFNNIVQGFLGQKGRVHIGVGEPLDEELGKIEEKFPGQLNKQINAVAELLDQRIYVQYKLWPTNYLAYDLLVGTNEFQSEYSDKEIRQFTRRITNRSGQDDPVSKNKYLEMYANPVKNKLKKNSF